MPGINLETMRARFLSEAFGEELGRTASEAMDDSEVVRLLNAGVQEIARVLTLPETRDATLDVDSGTGAYLTPWNVRGTSIQAVGLKKTAGDPPIWLARKTEAQLELELGFDLDDVSQDSGTPAYWAFSNRNPGQLHIRPVPTWSYTDGVIVRFAAFTGQLSRIVHGTATGRFFLNSDIVLVSGSPDIRGGDEIGKVETLNFDGTTALSPIVRKWYPTLDSYQLASVGSDLLTNSEFVSDLSSWTVSAGVITWVNGKAVFAAGYSGNYLAQDVNVTGSVTYDFEVNYRASIGASMALVLNGVVVATLGSTDDRDLTVSFQVTAVGSGAQSLRLRRETKNGEISVDGVNFLVSETLRAVILATPYEEPTATSASWVSAEVPDIEYAVKEGFSMSAVDHALSKWLKRRGRADLAADYAADFNNAMSTYVPEEPGVEKLRYGRRNPTAAFLEFNQA